MNGILKSSRWLRASVVLAIVLTLAGIAGAQTVIEPTPRVIPRPQRVESRGGEFVLGAASRIVLDRASERSRTTAGLINEELVRRRGAALRVEQWKGDSTISDGAIFIGSPVSAIGRKVLQERQGTMRPGMGDEGYFLDVSQRGIAIIAQSDRGQFYGVMSLLQLIRQRGEEFFVRGIAIDDFPQHAMRGISDDISRGQVSTLENFKSIIRFLARYKLNTYSPYIEDMFTSSKHSLIGKGRGALTPNELKELDAYAKNYFVDIVPIFQTLGHCENLLSIPEYAGYAEYPGGRTLNVSDEKTYTFLDEMIGELCTCFSASSLNMGADETRDVGLGASKDRVVTLGLPAVLAEHYRRVAKIIRKHGKKPMIYGDILLKNPEILSMIPKDITIVDWNYDPQYQYESQKIFRKAGFQVVVSPAIRNYRGPFLDHLNSFENIERFGRAGYEDKSIGLLISSWNDYGGEELRELNYYGYAWGAECAWNATNPEVVSFNKSFFTDFFGTDRTEPIQSVYTILASPANYYTWYELWRHPMLPFMPTVTPKNHSPVIMERLQSIKSTMPLVLSLIRDFEGSATLHKEQLSCLSFVARLNLWFAKKVETEETVRALSTWGPHSSQRDSVKSAIVSLCTGVIDDLSVLRPEFESLWNRTNKPEGLEYLLLRYDRQTAFWKEKIDEVNRGEFWVNPEIESSWIYHPDIVKEGKKAVQVQHAYFRKVVHLPTGVRSAKLQLIGDTYVRLSVNGHEVGDVFVRRSNSLSAEHKRIKLFEVGPFLDGPSAVITAEASEYSTTGSAGLNLYGEVQLNDGSFVTITSDSTWHVTTAPGSSWKDPSFDDSRWDHAVVKQYPYPVDRPDFKTNRLSWIEQ